MFDVNLPRTFYGNNPLFFAVTLLGFIFCVTLHQFAQAFVADRLGDRTARNERRLSLSPFAQLDPFALILGTFFALGIIPIAWAKPVPVNSARLRGGRTAEALVAFAGPLANLLVAGLLALVFSLTGLNSLLQNNGLYVVSQIVFYLIQLNLILFAFNLIPIPPLAGWAIIRPFLPATWVVKLFWLERYGLAILLIYMLFLSNLLSTAAGEPLDPLGWVGWTIANFIGGLIGV